ncbi:MAG: glycoside hydrolase family 1 protein [Candidatus Omnitrophota bacterium]
MVRHDRFLWGSATSAHQVEGNNVLSDWWEWERRGKIKEPSGLACDHYSRYKDDFAIIKNLGHTAHRFSIEWSRLEPKEGASDESAWEHYRDVIGELRSLDIEPIVTLNHFTLPNWLAEKGGWSRSLSVDLFERFAKKAVEKLGDSVSCWITINEPMVYALSSYLYGRWPPMRASFQDMAPVVINMIRGHAKAYTAMRKASAALFPGRKISIGIAKGLNKFDPFNKRSPFDALAVFSRHRFFNHLFITSLMSGWIRFPGFGIKKLSAAKTLDFLGVNYYTRQFVRYSGSGSVKLFGEDCGNPDPSGSMRRNFLGWEVYPEGLYLLLKDISKYRLPCIITENGICADDDGDRSRFIEEHLDALFRAKAGGVRVFGYLYWSLLDNFEWADGYGPRFGIVDVDYKTQKRTVRKSAYFLSELMRKKLAET